MYVEFFQAYGGTRGTSDPGYADFRINCNGARYTGACDPNGSRPRRVSKITQKRFEAPRPKGGGFIRLTAEAESEMAPRLESVLRSYVEARA